MAQPSPSKYWRLRPTAESGAESGESVVTPREFLQDANPRHGVLLASWDPGALLGRVTSLGVIRQIAPDFGSAQIDWKDAEICLRPNPTGRRWWTQSKPYFAFAKDVAVRYALDDLFAEHFSEYVDLDFGTSPRAAAGSPRPSASPTGGYIYVIRSPHDFKIGKTVNLKQRTRLFEVKLPFKNSLEHYAWFDDYTHAERLFHLRFHDKRLEGEWFELSPTDLAEIKNQGTAVAVEGLQ
jgi:hypothetical protein